MAVLILLYGCTTWRKSYMETTHECYFEQILEGTPAATYLLSHKPSKTNKTCRRSKAKFINNILLWTPTYRCINLGWPAKTYIHQFCADTRCCLEDLPGATYESQNSVLSVQLDDVIVYELLVLDKNTINHTSVCKLFLLDRNIWYLSAKNLNLNTKMKI